MKKILAVYQKYMIRPIVYKTVTKAVFALTQRCVCGTVL